jgi:branched-chain amino acid aminotransferase
MIVYLNGEYVEDNKAVIAVDDRGLLHGDAVFETCRWHKGGYFRFGEHMHRFARGAQSMRLQAPATPELRRIADQLAARNPADDAVFRVTLTRGRALAREQHNTVLATLQPLPADWPETARRGWSLITAQTRHPPLASLPSHIKSVGRLHGILARFEAEDAGADDALLLSPEGDVVEGPSWNVFWRKERMLFTPSIETGILEGVTRSIILGLAVENGYAAKEGRWSRAALAEADEMFACMTSLGIVPIKRLDGKPFGAQTTAADLISAAYWRLVSASVQ